MSDIMPVSNMEHLRKLTAALLPPLAAFIQQTAEADSDPFVAGDTVIVSEAILPEGYTLSMQINDIQRTFVVCSGRGTVEVGGVRQPIKAGDMAKVGAGIGHSFYAETDCRLIALLIPSAPTHPKEVL